MDMQPPFARYLYTRILITILALTPALVFAQQPAADTMRLTVSQAEVLFLQKNLTLLANQYNIDVNKALVQQAKAWDNPTLITDQNVYDGKFFRHTTENGQQYGQVYIQVQQLIRTAGKIKKQTQLAQDNVSGAQAQFNDVMRNLKYVLTTDLNNLSQLQSIATVYQSEIETVQPLGKGMDEMLKLGDVSQKENVRIKALLFSLENDYNDNIRQQLDIQKEIASLLQLNDGAWVIADGNNAFTPQQVNDLKIAMLQDTALQSRPDLALAKNQLLFQQHNIDYQQALAKPDLTVGLEYDRLNSYVPNYYGLAVSLPLPLFNRNKGNIEAARLASKQSAVFVQQAQNQVSKDVWSAWQKLLNATAMINKENTQLKDNYDVLMKNMLSSYRQRQVNLIEFIDFIDAYRDTRIKQGQLVTNQRNAVAELNYSINQNIITL
jgi:cobalt-zinc-cadmium efflux system outer membrane protein